MGQSPVSLRLLSWFAYALGAGVMVAQAAALAPRAKRLRTMVLAALMALCSPYPVRFAIEGKSYALLVLLVALGWCCDVDFSRCSSRWSNREWCAVFWRRLRRSRGCCSANRPPMGRVLVEQGVGDGWGHADEQGPAGLRVDQHRFLSWIEAVRLITASLDGAHLAAEAGQSPAVGRGQGAGDAGMEQC
jgi:hypothetical protein